MADFTLPIKVLTQRDAARSLDLRGLTMIAPCAAPAAAKLASPSATRWASGCSANSAQAVLVAPVKSSLASKRTCCERPSSLSSTAANNGALFSEPRPGLPL